MLWSCFKEVYEFVSGHRLDQFGLNPSQKSRDCFQFTKTTAILSPQDPMGEGAIPEWFLFSRGTCTLTIISNRSGIHSKRPLRISPAVSDTLGDPSLSCSSIGAI